MNDAKLVQCIDIVYNDTRYVWLQTKIFSNYFATDFILVENFKVMSYIKYNCLQLIEGNKYRFHLHECGDGDTRKNICGENAKFNQGLYTINSLTYLLPT